MTEPREKKRTKDAERRKAENERAESVKMEAVKEGSGEKTEKRQNFSRDVREEKLPEENVEKRAVTAGSFYVIRPGDSLYQISMGKYGNTDYIEEICKRNGLSVDEIIYPGQIIVLP